MRHHKVRYAAVLAAVGAFAVPSVASAQGVETTDDPLYNETTAPFLENTIFHTDQGADYRSDGGTGATTGSDYHSDDNRQYVSFNETLVTDGTLTYEATYNQISDTSVNDLTAGTSSDGGTANYTRDRENNSFTTSVTLGGQTTTVSSPNVVVPTGYQLWAAVTK